MLKPNLTVIPDTDHAVIIEKLASMKAGGFHANNGTYRYSAERVIPTTLAAFEYVTQTHATPTDALLIAVNSDVSMAAIMDESIAKASTKENKEKAIADKMTLESQEVRATKIAAPLARQHPKRPIIVVYYDDSTPTPLYQALHKAGLPLASLFKFGYGTSPDAPRIEGAVYFKHVLAFPLLNDLKPACHDLTAGGPSGNIITVCKLHEKSPAVPAPYLSIDGKILFPLQAPSDAALYCDPGMLALEMSSTGGAAFDPQHKAASSPSAEVAAESTPAEPSAVKKSALTPSGI